MPLTVLGEAVARIEHKLDALLRALDVKADPLHFVGGKCPVCQQEIDHRIDIEKRIVVRKCGCSTGKQPPLPLLPVGTPQMQKTASRRSGNDE